MTFREGLKICEKALCEHKGGKKLYLELLEIVEDYFEDLEIESMEDDDK